MAIQFNRSIGYTQSWKSTFLIGIILAAVFSFILIFLQPFDTYASDIAYKNLKLAGYSIPILLAVFGIHFIENNWFQKSSKWTIWNEIIIMFIGTVVITALSFIYMNNFVNPTALPWSEFVAWFRIFGLPFTPIFLVLWIYLRFSFSKIELTPSQHQTDQRITIKGTNVNEILELNWSDFLLAKSQANYIEVFHIDSQAQTTKKVILRSTLSKVLDQLPDATQTHRSYVINLEHVVKIEGNMRKGWCYLKGFEDQVPVSPKHFKALKMHLQNRP